MAVLDLIPEQIPYPIRGGLIRGVRTFIAIVLAGVSASIADGSLLGLVKVLPAEYAPAVTAGLTVAFVGIDKWFRERDLVADLPPDEEADIPTSGPTDPTTGDVPAEEPVADGLDPNEFDDPVEDKV